jgi:Ca2+-binding EF-hand superfamily protein
VLSVVELDAMMAGFRAAHIKRRLTAMDTDGDGTVNSEEFSRSRGRWMHHLDGNGDGAIDKAEMEKMANHHADARGSHHSKRGHHGKH